VTNAEIADQIVTALGEYLKRDRSTIAPGQALRDDLGLDSMATIELLFRIEEVFDLQIPDQDLQHLRTVANVIDYVQARLNPTAASTPSKAAAPGPAKPAPSTSAPTRRATPSKPAPTRAVSRKKPA